MIRLILEPLQQHPHIPVKSKRLDIIGSYACQDSMQTNNVADAMRQCRINPDLSFDTPSMEWAESAMALCNLQIMQIKDEIRDEQEKAALEAQ